MLIFSLWLCSSMQSHMQPPPLHYSVKIIITMQPHTHQLKNGQTLLIRQVEVEDTSAVMDFVYKISGESDFLTFGPGEFELTEAEEQEFIYKSLVSENQLFIFSSINNSIVALLHFSASPRPRIRHCGEIGLSVRKEYWGLGIGSIMLDTLIE